MSTLPDIATMIPIKLFVCASSGSESVMGDVQGKAEARLRRDGGNNLEWVSVGTTLVGAEEGGGPKVGSGNLVPVNTRIYTLHRSEDTARGLQ